MVLPQQGAIYIPPRQINYFLPIYPLWYYSYLAPYMVCILSFSFYSKTTLLAASMFQSKSFLFRPTFRKRYSKVDKRHVAILRWNTTSYYQLVVSTLIQAQETVDRVLKKLSPNRGAFQRVSVSSAVQSLCLFLVFMPLSLLKVWSSGVFSIK